MDIIGSATLKLCPKNAESSVGATESEEETSSLNSDSDTFHCPQSQKIVTIVENTDLVFHGTLLLAYSLQTVFFFPFSFWNFVLHLPTFCLLVLFLFATIF